MAKCTICQTEIILQPSANERARRYGDHPAFHYTSLFTTHPSCLIEQRRRNILSVIEAARLANRPLSMR
jgi:hypothetical protein